MKTIKILGMYLPILKDLGCGYYAVLHENGPAMAWKRMDGKDSGDEIITLDGAAEAEWPCEEVAAAVDAYIEYSWMKLAVLRDMCKLIRAGQKDGLCLGDEWDKLLELGEQT